MKYKLLPAVHSAICHLALAIALSVGALAQTTTLTINNATGQINVPPGLTPYFDLLNVASTPVPLIATPQRYGAIADGTSHPVSEWVTSGRYANLAAIQADYPHVVSLSDEIDWAAAQQALRLNKSVFMPAGNYVLGNDTISHTLNSFEAGQQVIGAGMNDPHGTMSGTLINAGSGTDGIRFTSPNTCIRNLSVFGKAVSIHSLANSGGNAVLTTNVAHGLRTTPEISGAWTITGNTVSGQTIVTTSAPHHLTTGDWIKISGSSGGVIDGIYRVLVVDGSGQPVAINTPNTTDTRFALVNADRSLAGAGSNGGACSFVKMYEICIGPFFSGVAPLLGADPEVLGFYRVLPTSTTALDVYKLDNTRLVMTTPPANDTGILYTTRRAISYGDDEQIYNSQDSGHGFHAENLHLAGAGVGFYGGSSDGGSVADHLVITTCGFGFWADGDLDVMRLTSPWIDGSIVRGITVTSNGGLIVQGGGLVNCARPICVGTDLVGGGAFGSHIQLQGVYFEGHQRDKFADNTDHYYVDIGVNCAGEFDGLIFQDSGEDPIHFHQQYGNMTVRHSSSFVHQLKAAQFGGVLLSDPISNIKSNLWGVVYYTPGNYWAYTTDQSFDPTQLIGGFSQSGSSTTVAVEDSSIFTAGVDYVNIWDTGTANDGINLPVTSIPDSTHIVVTHAAGVTAGGAGVIEKLGPGIPGARFSNVGQELLMLPFPPANSATGKWQVLNIEGRPKWSRVDSAGWLYRTGNFNALSSCKYQVDATGGAITAILPAVPAIGDEVVIVDTKSNFATNNLTISRNGQKINGATSNYVASTNGATVTAVFVSYSYGWSIK